ncbi:hypothetical protein Pyn_03191 [Prunus yedoensis var. nudiflora]|uniref:Uncharacterized protein n=1 Tax=Prunus yedoensis var. nudiflora TaxID=2094558 RepID=A0A314ZMR9_PRUYE|nr:hypothetical protein Pyn_03191 [Prunus yedoensis var. nudiflora]
MSPGNGRQALHFQAQVHRKGLKPYNHVEILLLLMVTEGQALVVHVGQGRRGLGLCLAIRIAHGVSLELGRQRPWAQVVRKN